MAISFSIDRHLSTLECLKPALAWRCDAITLQAGVNWFKYSDIDGGSCRTRSPEELEQLLKTVRAIIDCELQVDGWQTTSCQLGANTLYIKVLRTSVNQRQYSMACNCGDPLSVHRTTLEELGNWLSFFIDGREAFNRHMGTPVQVVTSESGILLYLDETILLPLTLAEAMELQRTLLAVVAECTHSGDHRSLSLADSQTLCISGNDDVNFGQIRVEGLARWDGGSFSELDMVLLAAELDYQLDHRDELLEQLLRDEEEYPL